MALFLEAPPNAQPGQSYELVGEDGNVYAFPAENPTSSVVGAAASLVWRPGGVAAPGVYVTEAAVIAALATIDAAAVKVVAIDTSIAPAVATLPWTLENCVMTSGGVETATLVWNGGTIVNTTSLYLLNVAFQCTAGPTVWSPPAGFFFSMDSALVTSSGSEPAALLSVNANDGSMLMENGSVFGDGTDALVKVQSAGEVIVAVLTGSTIDDNAFAQGTAPGGVCVFEADGSAFVSTLQQAGPDYGLTILDPIADFVWQPGGTAGGIVHTDWETLHAAYRPNPGPKRILVDTTFGTATIPPGEWYVDNVSFSVEWGGSGTGQIFMADGCELQWNFLEFTDGIAVVNQSTTPVTTFSTGQEAFLVLGKDVTFESTAAGVFVAATNGAQVLIWSEQGQPPAIWLGDGTHPVFSADAASLLVLKALYTTVDFNVFSGLGHLLVYQSPTSLVTPQPITTTTLNLTGQSSLVGFTPGVSGNWNPVPTVVNAALNQLAAANVLGVTSTLATGPSPASFAPSGTISRTRTGHVRVSGGLSGTADTAGVLTMALYRDVTIIAQAEAPVTAGGAFALSIDVLDLLSGTSAHAYSWTVTNSNGGNLTGVANGEYLWTNEL